MWKRRQRTDQLQSPVDPRSVLAARDAAFQDALRDLKNVWAGKPEEEVRVAVAAQLDRIGEPYSEPELELLTLEVVDEDWAARDPERLESLLGRLHDAAKESPDPFEDEDGL